MFKGYVMSLKGELMQYTGFSGLNSQSEYPRPSLQLILNRQGKLCHHSNVYIQVQIQSKYKGKYYIQCTKNSNVVYNKGVTILILNRNRPKLSHSLELRIKNGITDSATPLCRVWLACQAEKKHIRDEVLWVNLL